MSLMQQQQSQALPASQIALGAVPAWPPNAGLVGRSGSSSSASGGGAVRLGSLTSGPGPRRLGSLTRGSSSISNPRSSANLEAARPTLNQLPSPSAAGMAGPQAMQPAPTLPSTAIAPAALPPVQLQQLQQAMVAQTQLQQLQELQAAVQMQQQLQVPQLPQQQLPVQVQLASAANAQTRAGKSCMRRTGSAAGASKKVDSGVSSSSGGAVGAGSGPAKAPRRVRFDEVPRVYTLPMDASMQQQAVDAAYESVALGLDEDGASSDAGEEGVDAETVGKRFKVERARSKPRQQVPRRTRQGTPPAEPVGKQLANGDDAQAPDEGGEGAENGAQEEQLQGQEQQVQELEQQRRPRRAAQRQRVSYAESDDDGSAGGKAGGGRDDDDDDCVASKEDEEKPQGPKRHRTAAAKDVADAAPLSAAARTNGLAGGLKGFNAGRRVLARAVKAAIKAGAEADGGGEGGGDEDPGDKRDEHLNARRVKTEAEREALAAEAARIVATRAQRARGQKGGPPTSTHVRRRKCLPDDRLVAGTPEAEAMQNMLQEEGLPSEGIASVLKTLHRLRRAPGIDKMRERVQRYVGLVARFDRPSMLLWVRRYPQLLNHKTSSLLQSIESMMQLLSPAYMLPDRVFEVMDKCPQLATRKSVKSKLDTLERHLGCTKRRLGTAIHYFPTFLTMSDERLGALMATIVASLSRWPRGQFTALMITKCQELEAATNPAAAAAASGPTQAQAAAAASVNSDGAGQAEAAPKGGSEQQQQDQDMAEPPAAASAASSPSASPPSALQLPSGPLPAGRAAALASTFLLAQPQMLIKSPDVVRTRWQLLDEFLDNTPGANDALMGKKPSTYVGFFNAPESTWRIMTLRRRFLLEQEPETPVSLLSLMTMSTGTFSSQHPGWTEWLAGQGIDGAEVLVSVAPKKPRKAAAAGAAAKKLQGKRKHGEDEEEGDGGSGGDATSSEGEGSGSDSPSEGGDTGGSGGRGRGRGRGKGRGQGSGGRGGARGRGRGRACGRGGGQPEGDLAAAGSGARQEQALHGQAAVQQLHTGQQQQEAANQDTAAAALARAPAKKRGRPPKLPQQQGAHGQQEQQQDQREQQQQQQQQQESSTLLARAPAKMRGGPPQLTQQEQAGQQEQKADGDTSHSVTKRARGKAAEDQQQQRQQQQQQ